MTTAAGKASAIVIGVPLGLPRGIRCKRRSVMTISRTDTTGLSTG